MVDPLSPWLTMARPRQDTEMDTQTQLRTTTTGRTTHLGYLPAGSPAHVVETREYGRGRGKTVRHRCQTTLGQVWLYEDDLA